MENAQLRKWILQSFKLHGYSIRADATSCLAAEFEPLGSRERQLWMESITDRLQKFNLKSLIVDKEHIQACLQECTRRVEDAEKVWNVIDIFQVPQFAYCSERNKFVKNEGFEAKGLFPDAQERIMIFRRRYNFIYHRMLRHDLFRQQKLVGAESPQFSLKTVEWFLCCTERIENAVIIGLLIQKNEKTYAIEDLTGTLELDVSKAKFHDGLFPEHCFVLVEGIYADRIFHVEGIGFPPAEPSVKSRAYFGNVNVFGGPAEHDLSQCPKMKGILEKNADAMIVFISDVWLDRIEVLEKLRTLFSGFRSHPPLAFVLMGNFLFGHKGSQNAENLRAGLKSLGEIVAREKEILDKSHIVLVPGPSDPASPHILPRPPIPASLANGLTSLVPKVVLATNPCRIRYCTREIVVVREDLIKKMCRNTIHFPATDDIPTHFAKTIASQGTLVPMSPNVCPVYWNYSHCLDIYPLPDVIVTADQFNAFDVSYAGCTIVNPGSFMKTGFSFRVYLPQSKQVEESVIPDGMDSQS